MDHPLVTRREINALVEAYQERTGHSKIFIPTFKDQEGRPVLFHISLREEILTLGPEPTGQRNH